MAGKKICAGTLAALLAVMTAVSGFAGCGKPPVPGQQTASGNEFGNKTQPESGSESGNNPQTESDFKIRPQPDSESDFGTGSGMPDAETEPEDRPSGMVRVLFSTPDTTKAPLLKKYDQFTPTWEMGTALSSSKEAEQLMPSIAKLKAENFRVDLFMGIGGSIGSRIGGTEENNGKDFVSFLAADRVAKLLQDYGMNPSYVYFANPVYTGGGPENDSWKTPPDPEKWEELCCNIAAHFKNEGIRLGGHEIWNEPDFGQEFYRGGWDEYIATYIAGARGIRRGDPDAAVGGPSGAEVNRLIADGRMKEFLDEIAAENAPFDFLSWHYYGREGNLRNRENNFEDYLFPLRELLNSYPEFAAVQQNLNEFNLFRPAYDPVYRTADLIPHVFEAIERLNSATDITRVSWACTIGNSDLGGSLINKDNGERYPAFRALWCYARIPADRVETEISRVPGVEAMAACDGGRAGVILYHTGLAPKRAVVSLEEVPFNKADMTVYLMGENYDPGKTVDAPVMLEHLEGIDTDNLEYVTEIPGNGAVYIEINASGAAAQKDGEKEPPFSVVRKDYWYPQRGDDFAAADFYEPEYTGYVWTGNASDDQGCDAAVTIDLLQQKTLTVTAVIAGTPIKYSDASALGIRIDYHTADGYTKSVLYPLAGLDGAVELPYGCRTAPETGTELAIGTNELALEGSAPDGWDGRIMLHMTANNCGKNVYAKFIYPGDSGREP